MAGFDEATEKFAEEIRENKTVLDAVGLGVSVARGSTLGMAFGVAKVGVDVAREVKDDVKDAYESVKEDFTELNQAIAEGPDV